LNHAYDRIINPAMAQGGVANAPILLPLSGAWPRRRDLPLAPAGRE
jgi:hypothetical protein